jgi:hypothetical protein
MFVEFWFDPGCPFTWVTSRWLQQVAPERHVVISWRPLSLLIRNQTPEDKPWYVKHRRGRDLLRVVEATRAAGHADRLGELYTEFGRRIHNRGELDFDVAAVLDELGLERSLADAIEQESWDEAIQAAMADGASLAGEDVASPLIAVEARNGRVGYSGPILTELPSAADGLELWDGFVKMAGTPGFWELKRQRTAAPTPPPESPITG